MVRSVDLPLICVPQLPDFFRLPNHPYIPVGELRRLLSTPPPDATPSIPEHGLHPQLERGLELGRRTVPLLNNDARYARLQCRRLRLESTLLQIVGHMLVELLSSPPLGNPQPLIEDQDSLAVGQMGGLDNQRKVLLRTQATDEILNRLQIHPLAPGEQHLHHRRSQIPQHRIQQDLIPNGHNRRFPVGLALQNLEGFSVVAKHPAPEGLSHTEVLVHLKLLGGPQPSLVI
mmetsp:Transcript_115170/g.264471  ORF Transcript_115170/g.264471 Transcript_115170/m.264471 type:complete len:231 (+) Transcript_115170:993-1685(+)